ncbi:DUF397 domain-containing protein [Streptomyces marincola]|uniref:DUF397 domain-containing protein n=1 Tax=Streptomyces marincola TaxID=2878388 RepID=A0A1W7CYW9_9ACTN|nr:DUF397 domain-containing protein [Streptomyces marincola]ARQ69859.1 DUF397 domain-containing protein [Streptomyces marincola]
MNARTDDLYAVDLTNATWRRSSRSNGAAQCVEAADIPGGGIAIRDSKDPHRTPLRWTTPQWDAFRQHIVDGTL